MAAHGLTAAHTFTDFFLRLYRADADCPYLPERAERFQRNDLKLLIFFSLLRDATELQRKFRPHKKKHESDFDSILLQRYSSSVSFFLLPLLAKKAKKSKVPINVE